MKETGVRHSDIARLPNAASAHARIDGVVRPVNPFVSDNSDAAGGIVTSARDIAKWLVVQLDFGPDRSGTRLFSLHHEGTLVGRHSPGRRRSRRRN